MKKIAFSLALLFASFAGLTARAQGGMKIGLKLGNGASSFSGTDSKDAQFKSNFQAGVLANFALSDLVSIQPELLYSLKGTGYKKGGKPFGVADEARTSLHYLDVPILAKVTAGDHGTGLFFEAGPQASFLLSQNTYNDKSNKALPGDFGDSTAPFNKVAIGYVAGLGYQFANGLGLGLRYTGDFSQVYKDGKTTYSVGGVNVAQTNPNVRNSAFQVQVHYLLGGND